ncbi:hypothetical protein [Shewanella sp. ALD9]|uniref:hypothetical protein n=1 Tax=Shewanella sp. ALD9 TaxID=2058330 RepID=UPI000C321198|nr:hypothetical protein [Shewanella sp. ALD9]PKH33668.1 hypothetical protein CXF88_06145 [Shewanella sp. ALD9]
MNKLLFIIIVTLIQGCGTLAKTYLPDQLIADNDYGTEAQPIPYFNPEGEIKLTTQDIINLNANKEQRKAFIAQAILSSDNKCTQHQATIISNGNAWNVSMGSLSMLLTGTAAVISHAQTAAELAAGATAVTGIQSIANEEIYANAMSTAIVRAMDVSRTKSRAVINQKILEEDDDEKFYSLENALVDIQRYHSQCSFMAGLVEITKALEQRKLSSQELLYKQKQLESNIASFNASISAQEQTLEISPKVRGEHLEALAEMNKRLKSLILESVDSPSE